MKSKIIFCLLFTVCWTTAFAQRDELLEVRKTDSKHLLQIGPKIGVAMTTMGQLDDIKLYDGSGMGFSAGLVSRIRFGNATLNSDAGTGLFGLGLELKFKQNNVKTIAEDESGGKNANLSISYLEIPVLFQIYPFYKSQTLNGLYVEFGPEMALALSCSPEKLTVYNPNGEIAAIEYNINSNGSKLRGNDFRAVIGLGYTIPNTNLDINTRYHLGMSELAKNLPCKMNSVEVSLSWLFNAADF